MAGPGLLLVMHNLLPEYESEFRRWWGRKFMSTMLSVPGVEAAWFYRAVEGRPKYLQIYDLSDLEVMETPEYLRARGWCPGDAGTPRDMFSACSHLTVGIYEELLSLAGTDPDLSRTGAAMLAGIEVGPEQSEEFEDWYNTEHLPNLAGATGVLRARRFRLSPQARGNRGEPVTYLAVYETEDLEAYAREEWTRLGQTAWTRRLKRYFTLPLRNIYERILPGDGGGEDG